MDVVEPSLPFPSYKATGLRRRPPHVAVARSRAVCLASLQQASPCFAATRRVAGSARGASDKPALTNMPSLLYLYTCSGDAFYTTIRFYCKFYWKNFQGIFSLRIYLLYLSTSFLWWQVVAGIIE